MVVPETAVASPTSEREEVVKPTSTVAPPPPPVLLSLIKLPDVAVRIDGCEPRPRFSAGAAGGTVPWPTPTPGSGEGQDPDLAEIQIAVFRGVAARVVSDADLWARQVASDMESARSIQEARKLGWVLARVVAPMCSAMSIAPWPEKYESFTTEVEGLLVDLSLWGRGLLLEEQSVSIDIYRSQIQSISNRAAELVDSFSDVEILSFTTGSDALGFFLPIPVGWHTTKIDSEFRVTADYDSQLALLESTDERTFSALAGMRVRALRRVPDSSESQWITNGELLFPGYQLEKVDDGEVLRLTFEIDGARAAVDILVGEKQIYYVQTVCSDTDRTCLEFAESIRGIADFR